MKAIKLNFITLFVIALVFSSASVLAQQENNEEVKKEIIIVKKTVDEEGNVQVKRIVKTADTEDVIIESIEGEDIEIDVLDGEDIQVIEWEGMEGLSDEMKEKLENIYIDVDDNSAHSRVKIIMDKKGDGGEPVIIEWEGDGDIPEDIKMKMHENGVNWHGNTDHDAHAYGFVAGKYEGNKACLGVMIGKTVENNNGVETVHGESDLGVTVLDIIENSGAQEAGLLKDDIITAINGTSVATIHDVLDVLKPFEGGETVAIDYLRSNQPAQVNATLKTCENKMKKMRFENLEENMNWVEEGERTGENQDTRIIVIKKRTNNEDGTTEVIEKIVTDEGDEVAKTETPDDIIFNSTENQMLQLQDFSLFPNPTAGNLTVEFRSEAVPTTVKIFDITGKEIYSEELTTFDGHYKKEISLQNAPKGTLMLTVKQNDKVFAEKVVAQ